MLHNPKGAASAILSSKMWQLEVEQQTHRSVPTAEKLQQPHSIARVPNNAEASAQWHLMQNKQTYIEIIVEIIANKTQVNHRIDEYNFYADPIVYL
jgi:hypothetical protein